MFNPQKKDRAIFIYNPSSGKGQILKHLAFIKKSFIEKHGSIDIIKSQSKEFLITTIKNACKNYDYVYFSGGDGTFNIVLNAIPDDIDDDKLPIFGYLPGGSTNDMSYNLNLSKKPKKGIVDLLQSNVQEYNVGSFGDMKFIYVADFGMFTDVSHITPKEDKRRFGKLAYLYYAIKSLFTTVKSHEIIVDGVIYNTPLVIISNSREVGSFKINPEKKQNDGMYYIILVKDGKVHGLFNVLYLFAFGLKSAIKAKKVISLEAPFFQIDCSCHDWDVDGEYCQMDFPVTCGYSRKKIKVLTNRD